MQKRDLAQMLIASAVLLTVTESLYAQQAAPSSAPIPATDVPQLKTQLYNPQSTQAQRDRAASRLLVRTDPEARPLIAGALMDYSHPEAQLAAARALAENPTPDPSLIDSLFALIDPKNGDPLINAAAQSLTAYKSNRNVLDRLLPLMTNGASEGIRLAAIRACSTFVDKRVASTLLSLMDPTAQPPKINSAAASALSYMTGLRLPSNTMAAWQAWWDATGSKSDTDFAAEVALTRASRYDLTRTTVDDLQQEIFRLANEHYQKSSRDERSDLLLRFMRSPESAVRVIGCQIAQQAVETDVTVAPAIKTQLRQLIGDSSPEVRRRAAEALALINDADALVPLLTQLNQETDSSVRAAIADALRPIRDVRSVPLLMKLLDDPSIDTAQAAADALSERDLGQQLRQTDPVLADELAEKLEKTLVARTTAQNNIDLRNSLVRAMIPLQSRLLAAPLTRMLNSPAEAARVRRSLLQAVGEYHNPQFADSIGALLDDPDEMIRLAAVNAVGQTDASLGDFEQRLYKRIDPKYEPSSAVRDAAWQVLSQLFAKAPAEQLGPWELRLKDDPARLLVVLKAERDLEVKSGTAENAARFNQKIGDASRAAAAVASDPTNAAKLWHQSIAAYKAAMDYSTSAGKPAFTEILSEGLTQAYLGAHEYQSAIDFVQQQIKADPSSQGPLAPLIRTEVDRLIHSTPSDFGGAIQLIDLTMKMNPPLNSQFTDNFQDWRAEAQRRSKEQNLLPYGAMDGTLNAAAQ